MEHTISWKFAREIMLFRFRRQDACAAGVASRIIKEFLKEL